MYTISEKTMNEAYKPFDIVSIENGSVGYINEVSVNTCQDDPMEQLKYSITWLYGDNDKNAWWYGYELRYHCNLFIKIAEETCNTNSNNDKYVKTLFKHF